MKKATRVALIGAGGLVLASAIGITPALLDSGSGPGASQAPAPGHGSAPTSAGPLAAGKTWSETADNRRGIATYSNTSGTTSGKPPIPYSTTVDVSCYAPNNSGMGSINDFYLIADGQWEGDYAPANTFANGDPLGVPGGADIDPHVPPCPKGSA